MTVSSVSADNEKDAKHSEKSEDFSAEIEDIRKRVGDLMQQNEMKIALAVKNGFIPAGKEKEFFDFYNAEWDELLRGSQNGADKKLLNRYSDFYSYVQQKIHQLIPEAPANTRLAVKNDKNDKMTIKKNQPTKGENRDSDEKAETVQGEEKSASELQAGQEDSQKKPEKEIMAASDENSFGSRVYTSEEEELIYGREAAAEKSSETESKGGQVEENERSGEIIDEKYKEFIERLNATRSEFAKAKAEWKEIHDRDQTAIKTFKFDMGESASEIKAREILEEAEREYGKSGTEYGKKIYQDKLAALGENPSPEQIADLKAQVLEEIVFKEKDELARVQAELVSEKESGLCKKILQKYGELPTWAKLSLSAGVATSVAAFSAPALGAAGIGAYGISRLIRAAVGTTAGLAAGKAYGWLFDKIARTKEIRSGGEEAIKAELKMKAGQEEDLEKLFGESFSSARQKLEALSAKEKRVYLARALGQAAVIGGVAGLSSWGLGKYFEAAGITPPSEGPKAPLESSPPAGPESGAPGAVPAAPEGGTITSNHETLKIEPLESLATLQKGEGIENVLIRQLEADPANMGCDPEIIAKGKEAVHQWAQGEAHRIALQTEYVKIDPATRQPVETRVYWDEKNPARFRLTYDAANQEYTVYPENAKTYQWTAPEAEKAGAGPVAPEHPRSGAAAEAIPGISKEFRTYLNASPDDPRYKSLMTAKIGDVMNQIPREALSDPDAFSRLWHNQGEFSGRKILNLPYDGIGLDYGEYENYGKIAKFLHDNNAAALDPNLTLYDLFEGKASAAAVPEAPIAAKPAPATSEQIERIMHSEDAPPAAEKTPPVEKAAEVIGGLPSEKQKIVSGIISGMAEQGKTGTVAAQELVNQVKAGNLKIEEFGNYYAQQTGAERLSDKLMDNLKKTFADAQSSGTQKASGMMGIAIMLERLKQESLVK